MKAWTTPNWKNSKGRTKRKNHKVRARMVAVRMVRVRNMYLRQQTFKDVARTGFVTDHAVTTKESWKASETFPDVDGLEEFC